MVNKYRGHGKEEAEIIYKFHIPEIKAEEILNRISNYNSWRLLSFSNKLSSLSACYYKDFKKFIGLYK